METKPFCKASGLLFKEGEPPPKVKLNPPGHLVLPEVGINHFRKVLEQPQEFRIKGGDPPKGWVPHFRLSGRKAS